ncbi:hypothetical protein ARMGADRAFT_1091116 [Armillaria gallica]|uniref:Uncharacterized protein n=1 Tax=Armillaria gallica TaxID=47427 RepID=A0A2H3CEY8_ARMGA|nr:hypothetical protein ARMGADRAFT_1091116 [Armillaria gallica]
MLAIEGTNPTNPRTITIIVVAVFFSAALITLLGILCVAAYDTSRIEEDEEAHAALPFHYIPNHYLTPPPEARTCIIALGIMLAIVTTLITTTLLTLIYSREIRNLFTQLGVLAPVRCFQRYVRAEPGPRMGRLNLADSDPTPQRARNERRVTTMTLTEPQGNVWAEPNPWSSWEDAQPEPDSDYPSIIRWMDENIPAIFRDWPIPVGDLHPANHDLPTVPIEQDPPFPSWRETPLDYPPGQPRIPTPIPTQDQDPLSDEEDYKTLTQSPIHSPTQYHSTVMMTPSTHGDSTTSGLSSLTLTEGSLAPTEWQHGSSGEQTPRPASSGLTPTLHKSRWTSTLPSPMAIPSMAEGTHTHRSQPGFMPIGSENYTHLARRKSHKNTPPDRQRAGTN